MILFLFFLLFFFLPANARDVGTTQVEDAAISVKQMEELAKNQEPSKQLIDPKKIMEELTKPKELVVDSEVPNVSMDARPKKVEATVMHPHTTTKDGEKEEANIYLNFENATLESVVNYLAEEKKLNILPHKDIVTPKVTLTTRDPLTLERAWNVLLTLLEMNGFTIIKVDNVYRIVTIAENGQQPLPTYSSKTGTEPENLPDSDLVVRYIYFFKNIKTDVAQGILSTMLEGDKSILMNSDL